MKLRAVLILFIAFAGLSSCKKNLDLPLTTGLTSTLNVINTTGDTLNYYLNGTRQNIGSSIYSGGSTGYLSVNAGVSNYEFRKDGRNTGLFNKSLTLDTITSGRLPIATTTIKNATGATTTIVKRLKAYSLYVTNETADKAILKLDTIVVNSDSATVRFIHTADGVPALDLYIGDTNSSISFKNQTFGSQSQFKSAIAGVKTITVTLAGQTAVKATQRITLSSNNVFTLYVRGVPDGVGKSALTVGAFINQ